MMQAVFDPRAEEDIEAGQRYLEDQREGIGTAFLSELTDAIDQLEQFPRSAPIIESEIRRKVLRKFSYAIYYRVISESELLVITIQHTSQNPDRWKR